MTILRAAHCRSTHHYFALDAIPMLQTASGKQLGQILLQHHNAYLTGAKDPDTKFRDFRNHVLHVADNQWGGAPRACEKWLATAVQQLQQEQFKDAAYSLGVLSHYFTDPIMPLHTGSSEAEGVVHRPMEWSVCQTYEEIYRQIREDRVRVNFQLAQRDGWISEAVLTAAQQSHQHYHRIIEIYDLERGVKRPSEGLNSESREILVNMFAIAITGWARILERVAASCQSPLPEVSLNLATVVSAIQIPSKWVVRKIASAQEQRAVRAVFAEFERTGTVKTNLPEEVRLVRAERPMPNTPNATANEVVTAAEPVADTPATDSPATDLTATDSPVTATPIAEPLRLHINADSSDAIPKRDVVPSSAAPASYAQDLVDAPSIGPKTAKRFAAIGITTIGQFLASDATQMATQLDTRWITAELIEDWQAQATLVSHIGSLCGYKSQLLVAVGCRTPTQLADRAADELCDEITQFCQTKAGQRILRSSTPPEQTDVTRWIDEARQDRQNQAA
ncbi:hypothetical protein RMSM_04109 [Rhodopirellula maiorica SM1]|uniref:DUF4332 domain-containing protein n=2 Tax=Novipirellula TaxID=2795426 RepID=M5RIF7_9BACT|nr:hypothetical protein RMSM_04109 [Rhodopirellula maiorica SM1]